MNVNMLLENLNEQQRLAVSAPAQALLVLAGAGTGKTRVLVHRIAWQIQVLGCSPYSILAVTFTNKAAMEMRGRIESLLKMSLNHFWIGTFHSIAYRLLRRHAEAAKLPSNFQVIDSDDQLRLIKRILTDLKIDDKKWPANKVQYFINQEKENGQRALMIETTDFYQKNMQRFYLEYQQYCQRSGIVDFSELLLRSYELLRDNLELRNHYRQLFRQVHVDEFQDTNTIQYAWLKLLTENQNNLFIVGDDDQSIYSWRGAKVANLTYFQQDYPLHQFIKLEQNYRST
ncbi:MAG: hypothetical protein RL637_1160 [Pseudomonadota bacterium]|jgi:DNA helicase-2/ATP-dependent DNA helicase PcrA